MWNALTCSVAGKSEEREGCLCCYLLHHLTKKKNIPRMYVNKKNSCNTHAKYEKLQKKNSENYKIYICVHMYQYREILYFFLYIFLLTHGEKKRKCSIPHMNKDAKPAWLNRKSNDSGWERESAAIHSANKRGNAREMPTVDSFLPFRSHENIHKNDVSRSIQCSQRNITSACIHIINFVYRQRHPPATHSAEKKITQNHIQNRSIFAKHFLLQSRILSFLILSSTSLVHPMFDFLHGPSIRNCERIKQKMKRGYVFFPVKKFSAKLRKNFFWYSLDCRSPDHPVNFLAWCFYHPLA